MEFIEFKEEKNKEVIKNKIKQLLVKVPRKLKAFGDAFDWYLMTSIAVYTTMIVFLLTYDPNDGNRRFLYGLRKNETKAVEHNIKSEKFRKRLERCLENVNECFIEAEIKARKRLVCNDYVKENFYITKNNVTINFSDLEKLRNLKKSDSDYYEKIQEAIKELAKYYEQRINDHAYEIIKDFKHAKKDECKIGNKELEINIYLNMK
jgi:hypothetical protein